jgi:NAD(P)-dependent dehydrogenase (short-subunit alcohol dehydrogenase family)
MEVSRSVLITGCCPGIGAATAARLAAAGWTVYATARRPETLGELEAKGCTTLACDVDDEASCKAAVDAVVEAEGAIGVLINNAGFSQSGAVESIPGERVRAQFETNVFGMLSLCRAALPSMRAQGWGKLVNISSMGGEFVFPGRGVYHATKYAIEALSDALRYELAGFGIDVIVIQPGLIRSDFSRRTVAEIDAVGADAGAYASFNAAVATASKEAYEKGFFSRLGGPPEAVAEVIDKALTADRPKTRYKVTPSARVMMILHSLAGDRGWDRICRSSFPQPGPS